MPCFMNPATFHYCYIVGQENIMEQMKTLWPVTIIECVYFSITRADV